MHRVHRATPRDRLYAHSPTRRTVSYRQRTASRGTTSRFVPTDRTAGSYNTDHGRFVLADRPNVSYRTDQLTHGFVSTNLSFWTDGPTDYCPTDQLTVSYYRPTDLFVPTNRPFRTDQSFFVATDGSTSCSWFRRCTGSPTGRRFIATSTRRPSTSSTCIQASITGSQQCARLGPNSYTPVVPRTPHSVSIRGSSPGGRV